MVDLALLQSVSYIAGALGVCVAAVYYMMNLKISQKNQELSLKAQHQSLETRQTQLFMDIYRTYSSKEYQKDREQLLFIWKFKDYEDFYHKYGPDTNPEEHAKFDVMFTHLEGIGVLVRHGMISPDLVYDLMNSTVVPFWEKFLPIFQGLRSRMEAPHLFNDIEHLYDEMKTTGMKRSQSGKMKSFLPQ